MLFLFADTTPKYGDRGAAAVSGGGGAGSLFGAPAPSYVGAGIGTSPGVASGSGFDLFGLFSAPAPQYATPPPAPPSDPPSDDDEDDDPPPLAPPDDGEDDQ